MCHLKLKIMKKLENYGVNELKNLECQSIVGGSVWKILERIATVLAIGSAVDQFVDGWNSVECNNT